METKTSYRYERLETHKEPLKALTGREKRRARRKAERKKERSERK